MVRALLLIILPQPTWQRIAESRWNSLIVFFVSFVPLLAFVTAAEATGMTMLGASVNDFGRTIEVTQEQALQFQGVQVALTLIILILGTKMVQWVCDGFHSPSTFKQAFALTAYGITPLLWCRVFDAYPSLPTWVCFAIGAVGVVAVLYHGVAHVMEPDTSVGFGLYLISSIVLLLLAGLSHFIVQIIAQRKFNFASLLTDPSAGFVDKLL